MYSVVLVLSAQLFHTWLKFCRGIYTVVTMDNNYHYWKSTLANIFNQTKSEFVGCKFGIDITWSKRDDLCVQPVCFTLVKNTKI